MKVILLKDIPRVGNKYDVKDLKDGYVQNVLIPQGLACPATKAELDKLANKKQKTDKEKENENKTFIELITTINNKVINIKAKANDKGHLFKAVSPHDVSIAIKETTGILINEDSIKMEYIKSLGEHKVTIKKGDKKGECSVLVETL